MVCARGRTVDVPEKLVFVHVAGIQFPLCNFVLIRVVVFQYLLSGKVHKEIKGAYLTWSGSRISTILRNPFYMKIPDEMWRHVKRDIYRALDDFSKERQRICRKRLRGLSWILSNLDRNAYLIIGNTGIFSATFLAGAITIAPKTNILRLF